MDSITELKTIIQQLQSIDADTSMEEAYDMVENLTEELVVKEEKLMALEKDNKDLEDEKRKLLIDNDIYIRMGQYVCRQEYGNNAVLMNFADGHIDEIDNLAHSTGQKMRALEIWFNNNMRYFGHEFKHSCLTNEEVLEIIKEDYESYDIECLPPDNPQRLCYERILNGEEEWGDNIDNIDSLNMEYTFSLPWNENQHIIIWSM
tara:strand:+ start:696 stop:1307 length:612 start_codon:yes stop_codon:yes gene_type:complete